MCNDIYDDEEEEEEEEEEEDQEEEEEDHRKALKGRILFFLFFITRGMCLSVYGIVCDLSSMCFNHSACSLFYMCVFLFFCMFGFFFVACSAFFPSFSHLLYYFLYDHVGNQSQSNITVLTWANIKQNHVFNVCFCFVSY